MAIDSGRGDVLRGHRSGIRVAAGTAAAAGAFRRVLHGHAGRAGECVHAHGIAKANRRREGIVLTVSRQRPPLTCHFQTVSGRLAYAPVPHSSGRYQ